MFIVLDSIDGGGKGHQREKLLDHFKKNSSIEIASEEFPVHNEFYETVIHPALQEEVQMNKASWVLSYLLDKTLAADSIRPHVKSKDSIFIADGYFTTTIAYQSLLMKQVPIKRLLQYSEEFDIPKPDFCIYIDVDPEIAFKRKELEEGHDEGLDMFEKSINKQRKLRNIYKKMVKKSIYSKWFQIDGNNSSDDVTESILQVLRENNIA